MPLFFVTHTRENDTIADPESSPISTLEVRIRATDEDDAVTKAQTAYGEGALDGYTLESVEIE